MESMEPLSDLVSKLWAQKRRKKMPVISKVSTPHNGQATQYVSVADDPLADAVPVTSLRFDWATVFVYGPSGAGKTTFASMFPKPQLFLSYEPNDNGGCRSVSLTPGLQFKRVTRQEQAVNVARRLKQDMRSCWHMRDGQWWPHLTADGLPINDGLPFVTVTHDSGTSLEDVILAQLMGWDKMPVQLEFGQVPEKGYQKRSEQAKEVIREFIGIKAHLIILAKEKDHNKEQGERVKMRPDLADFNKGFWSGSMGKSTVEWIQDGFDFVMRMYPAPEEVVMPGSPIVMGDGTTVPGPEERRLTGRIVRRLRCTLSDTCAARFRSPNPESVAEYIWGTAQELYDDFTRMSKGQRAVRGYYPARG